MTSDVSSSDHDDFIILSNVCDSIGPFSIGPSLQTSNEVLSPNIIYCSTNSVHSSFDRINESDLVLSMNASEQQTGQGTSSRRTVDEQPIGDRLKLASDIAEIFGEIDVYEAKKAEMMRSLNDMVISLAGGQEELSILKKKELTKNEIKQSSSEIESNRTLNSDALRESLSENEKKDEIISDAVLNIKEVLTEHMKPFTENADKYFAKSGKKLTGFDELQNRINLANELKELSSIIKEVLLLDVKAMEKLYSENQSLSEVLKVVAEENEISENDHKKRIVDYRERLEYLEKQIISQMELSEQECTTFSSMTAALRSMIQATTAYRCRPS